MAEKQSVPGKDYYRKLRKELRAKEFPCPAGREMKIPLAVHDGASYGMLIGYLTPEKNKQANYGDQLDHFLTFPFSLTVAGTRTTYWTINQMVSLYRGIQKANKTKDSFVHGKKILKTCHSNGTHEWSRGYEFTRTLYWREIKSKLPKEEDPYANDYWRYCLKPGKYLCIVSKDHPEVEAAWLRIIGDNKEMVSTYYQARTSFDIYIGINYLDLFQAGLEVALSSLTPNSILLNYSPGTAARVRWGNKRHSIRQNCQELKDEVPPNPTKVFMGSLFSKISPTQ